MSAEEKNKLDELFKNGLDVPDTHFEYNDQDWDNMEQLMADHRRPRAIVYWLPILSSVAAILLLFLGWWLFKPAQVQQQPMAVVKHAPAQQPAVITNPDHNIANGITDNVAHNNTSVAHSDITQQPAKPTSGPAAPVYANTSGVHKQRTIAVPGEAQGNKTPVINHQPTPTVVEQLKQEVLASNGATKNNLPGNVAASNSSVDGKATPTDEHTAPANTPNPGEAAATKAPVMAQNKKPKLSGMSKAKPQFGLAMLVSPDINGAGSFQNAKVGTNLGLLFSVSIKRFTFSTGAAYSKKPYMTDFSNYHATYKFKTDPQDVYADCRVLDIPVNVDYKLYNKNHNSFSVGSGLSSYIMLKEKYTYDYADANAVGPASFTVTNKNKHILGVLNLNATYEHQINSKFSLAAQPYLKIPLTQIGNSRVKLQSAGVAVGVRWNINH